MGRFCKVELFKKRIKVRTHSRIFARSVATLVLPLINQAGGLTPWPPHTTTSYAVGGVLESQLLASPPNSMFGNVTFTPQELQELQIKALPLEGQLLHITSTSGHSGMGVEHAGWLDCGCPGMGMLEDEGGTG